MPEHGARPEQPEAMIDVGIARGLRIEAERGRDLVQVFGEMGLQMTVRMLTLEHCSGLELLRRRRDGKARRDRVAQATAAMPAPDQRLAVVVGRPHAVDQRARRIAVHHDLAGDHPDMAPLGLGEQCVD